MKTALLIIDIQNDFMPTGTLPVPNSDKLVNKINKFVEENSFNKVIATIDWHPKNHISFAETHYKNPFTTIKTKYGNQVLWPRHCVQNTKGATHPKDFRVKIDKYIFKGQNVDIDSYSGFFDNFKIEKTELDNYLKFENIEKLFICGVATEYCVYNTVIDAYDLGYNITVLKDLCKGVKKEDVKQALSKIKDINITIE
jgi:nicotinamidase/pyrazinamidase